ncbi:MAG: hypothetical protein IKE01_04655 [Clostridia bacterium]|nr:hypothetical protein [Clostridia bacterium]
MERYQDNLKDQLIEYQGRKLYVVDQVFYKGDYYVYVFNVDKYSKDETLEINFLKKLGNDELEVVTDMELFDKLMQLVGMNMVADKVKKLNFKVQN